MEVQLGGGLVLVEAVVNDPVQENGDTHVVLEELLDSLPPQGLHAAVLAPQHAVQPLVHVAVGPQPPGVENRATTNQGTHGLQSSEGQILYVSLLVGRIRSGEREGGAWDTCR